MSNIKEVLFALSEKCAVKNISEASDYAYKLFSQNCECKRCNNNLSFTATLKGESDYTILLDAHIDEVGFIVTNIDDNGFLTVAKCGGNDSRTIPAKVVTIHGKEDVKGVFVSTPPHLSSGEMEYDDISAIKLDTGLGAKAKEVISLGDMVTYCQKPFDLIGNRVCGKSFDDRAGVAVLYELSERLKDKKLPINVVFSIVDGEELGMRGAIPATFGVAPDEAIAIDVSFATAPDVSDLEGGYLGKGGMIGVSPILSTEVTQKLNIIADENNIPYQNEIMGGKTGTDSDVISVSGKGVKTGLISIPLRNMHTDCEIIDLDDLTSVCDILEKYILSGGTFND